MKDSPVRHVLGLATLFISGYVWFKYSFLWAIGAFILLNVVIAPVLNILEKNNIIKSTEQYDDEI